MQKLKNYIGGQYVEPSTGKYMENFNPSTGEAYSLIPDSDARDINAAVDAAKEAYPWWSSRTKQQRAQVLYSIADHLERRAEEFAWAETKDQGKPLTLAHETDMVRAVANFRFFAGAILHHQEEATQMDANGYNFSQRTPLGVAGLISPWNLPLYLLTWKIAPAIACGNTVVAKPSELTPMTAFMLGDVLNEAGLRHGVVNIVHGRGAAVGDALTQHPDVPLISFTGGTATGQQVIRSTAARVKKVSLELGGKNPGLIFQDADLAEAALTSIRSSFQNQGQICLCNSRLYVQESVYDEFMDKFLRLVEMMRVGDPTLKETNMGPLVSSGHREKVMSYIELAKKEGGKIAIGGDVPKLAKPFDQGYFLNPTVITGLKQDARCMQEEIFGPVVAVSKFKDEAEAVKLANDVPYGLSASVWSQDIKRATRVAGQIQAGTVWINAWMVRDLRVPFGGMKSSGLGREGGAHSIDFYTQQKNIFVKL